MKTPDVLVVGGGVMGLAVAGELSTPFDRVVVLEKDQLYGEASYASGGMLAPYMEVEYGEPELLQFKRRCLKTYPDFVAELEEETGQPAGLTARGSLYVAVHSDELQVLKKLHRFHRRMELPVENMEVATARSLEPSLRSNLCGALYAPEEQHINNRWLGLALYRRCLIRGVEIRRHEPVVDLTYGNGSRVIEVRTPRRSYQPGRVVIAAGAWSGSLPGLRPVDRLPLRPVKGQALAVRLDSDFSPRRIIRSPRMYAVPHHPERMVVGASMEERGFTPGTTGGKMMDLLEAAVDVLPGVKDQPLLERWWGFRPATRDSLPVIGPSAATEKLFFVTGHYRHGILLMPGSVKALVNSLTAEDPPAELEPFLPGRFQCPGEQTPPHGAQGQSQKNVHRTLASRTWEG